MRTERIFITGGAGFIGSRLVKALTDAGAEVLAFDNLHPQVHGPDAHVPLAAPLVRGDVRDRAALSAAVSGFAPTIVVHLAAETGTGQSADEPARYAEVNVVGTALLIECLRRAARAAPARRAGSHPRGPMAKGLIGMPGGSWSCRRRGARKTWHAASSICSTRKAGLWSPCPRRKTCA